MNSKYSGIIEKQYKEGIIKKSEQKTKINETYYQKKQHKN